MKEETTGRYELDDIDRSILSKLTGNARTSFTELAYIAGTSRATVRTRMESMEDLGIIEGYTVIVNRDLIKE